VCGKSPALSGAFSLQAARHTTGRPYARNASRLAADIFQPALWDATAQSRGRETESAREWLLRRGKDLGFALDAAGFDRGGAPRSETNASLSRSGMPTGPHHPAFPLP